MLLPYLKKPHFLYSLPIILSVIVLALVYTPPYDILHDKDIYVQPYSDLQSDGNSTVASSTDTSGNITYRFTLGDLKQFPYAGVMIYKKDSSLMDLSEFDFLSVKAKMINGKGMIPFYIFTNIENYSSWAEVKTFLNMQSMLNIDEFDKTTNVMFDLFFIPKWWYEMLNDDIPLNIEPNYGKVALLNFANPSTARIGKEYTISINQIIARKSMTGYYITTAVLLLLYYALLFSWKFINKKNTTNTIANKQVTFSYQKTQVNEKQNNDSPVFEFINNNYFTPELSIADVQEATDLSERKIAQIIKDRTDLSFKQYLNNIRLSEAKRLLEDTELQVSEIAYKIGYNNVPHFNRVFKSAENISPSNYRAQNGTNPV